MSDFQNNTDAAHRSSTPPLTDIFPIAAREMPDIKSATKPTVQTSPFDRLCRTLDDEPVALRYQGTPLYPNEIITTAITADDLGYECRFITESRKVAKGIMEYLQQPVWKTTDNGTGLFIDSTQPLIDEERVLLWPTSRTQPRWWLLPAGECQLRLAHQTLGSTKPANLGITLHRELPCIQQTALDQEQDPIAVTTTAGNPITTYNDHEPFHRDWTPLNTYLRPTQPHYCDIASVWFFDNGSLSHYQPANKEDTPDQSERLTASITEFLDQYTIPRANATIPLSDLFEYWQPWHTTAYSDPAPDQAQFVETLDSIAEISIEYSPDRKLTASLLQNRTWAYHSERG